MSIILWLLTTVPAAAQDSERRYRVELIVLMHLEHAEEPRERKWLTDYAAALDLLAPPEESEDATDETADETAAEPPGVADSGTDPAQGAVGGPAPEGAVEDADPFADVIYLPEPGEEMAEAWRRLRLSGPFRPLQYLSWEQDGDEPFPQLRVHDEEVVRIQDPWAEARAELEQAPAEAGPEAATAAMPGEAAGEEPALPPPTVFFQLDGTAQLTRSRFLHLALDLEWRQPVYDAAAGPDRSALGPDEATSPPEPDHYRVFQLQQRRQVRTGRMEYFDGPVLGVLARITRVRRDATDPADAEEGSEEWSE